MSPDTVHPISAPRIVDQPALTLVGITQHYRAGDNAGIPDQWRRFEPHLGQVEHEVRGVSYGVVYNVDAANNFDYLCGVEVTATGHVPADWIQLAVDAGTYAVFTHAGPVSTIQETFGRIWNGGLADAGVRQAGGPVLERYDERFDPRTGLGGFDILVPVIP